MKHQYQSTDNPNFCMWELLSEMKTKLTLKKMHAKEEWHSEDKDVISF